MKKKSTPFTRVDHEYVLNAKEIKDALGVKGEILSITLLNGRSPNDIEKGVSSDTDEWVINSQEVKDK